MNATAVPGDLIGVLGSAARKRQRIGFGYLADDRSRSIRQVDPYRIVRHGSHWYLLCWDLHRRDWRTFRLDRMIRPEPAGQTFKPREIPGDAAPVHLEDSVPPHRVVLVFDASLVVVADRLLTQEGEFEEAGEDRCRAVLWVDSYEWLAAVVLSMGIDFGVESPGEFRTHCAELRDRLDRAARWSPDD